MQSAKPKAHSAVTGGHPEEMNAMPPDTNPASPDPVHDGHTASPPAGGPRWLQNVTKWIQERLGRKHP